MMLIEPILTTGHLRVYKRLRGTEINIPGYPVFDLRTTQLVREFSSKRAAVAWAIENGDQGGVTP